MLAEQSIVWEGCTVVRCHQAPEHNELLLFANSGFTFLRMQSYSLGTPSAGAGLLQAMQSA